MFSGGKDSLACLFLLKPYLDKINVIWVNTGDMFPENIEIIRKFTKDLPHFIEINTDVHSFIEKFGFPSDIVPISYSHVGQMMTGDKPIKLMSGYDCCSHNLWFPALQKAQELEATLIIRGQRNEEYAKSPMRTGTIQDGIEFLFPLQEWSQENVLAYLKEQGFDYPEFFNFTESSLDCMHCTAFLSGIEDRKEYMKQNHPIEHEKNMQNLSLISDAIKSELETFNRYVS